MKILVRLLDFFTSKPILTTAYIRVEKNKKVSNDYILKYIIFSEHFIKGRSEMKTYGVYKDIDKLDDAICILKAELSLTKYQSEMFKCSFKIDKTIESRHAYSV
jgi:hypothetical protein